MQNVMTKAPDPMQPTLDTVALAQPAPGALPLISSARLFSQGNTLRVEHGGQYYQLRVTRENKLILTK